MTINRNLSNLFIVVVSFITIILISTSFINSISYKSSYETYNRICQSRVLYSIKNSSVWNKIKRDKKLGVDDNLEVQQNKWKYNKLVNNDNITNVTFFAYRDSVPIIEINNVVFTPNRNLLSFMLGEGPNIKFNCFMSRRTEARLLLMGW